MKKALIITAAAVGYLALEGLFVFGLARETGSPQLLFIVTTLGMLAALLYGSRPSAKKALIIVYLVPGVFVIFASLALAANAAERRGIPSAPTLFGGIGIILLALIALRSKRRKRSILIEAEQWLAERERERQNPVAWKWRKRSERWSLWIPTLIVTLTLAFWAPINGFITRPFHFGAGDLDGYRIHIPMSWTIDLWPRLRYDNSDVFLWKLRRMDQATFTLFRRLPTCSEVSFHVGGWYSKTDPHKEMDADKNSACKFNVRNFRIGSADVTCWDYVPNNPRNPDIWFANCSAPDGSFSSHFDGERADLEEFYEMIASAVQTKTTAAK